ncbi:MAG: hypothetical protein EpisKO_06330 [Epibacterium sp.]
MSQAFLIGLRCRTKTCIVPGKSFAKKGFAMMRSILAFLICASAAHAESSTEARERRCKYFDEPALVREICLCSLEEGSDLKRLACYDTAASRAELNGLALDAMIERISRRDGGMAAMKSRVDAAEAD